MPFLNRALIVVLMVLPLNAFAQNQPTLSLESYRNDVISKSPALEALAFSLIATKENEKAMDLATATRMDTQISAVRSSQPAMDSVPSYQGMEANTVEWGLSKQFTAGTKAKVNFKFAQNQLKQASFSALAPSSDLKIHSLTPEITVSQPLWQNWAGRSLDLKTKALNSQTDAQLFDNASKKRLITMEAELTYYRLAFARDRLAIATRTMETAQKILSFVQSRYQRNLYEKSDLLQAQALSSSRELELQGAKSEFENAGIAFNALRLIDSASVAEGLESLSNATVSDWGSPVSIAAREELKHFDAQIQSAKFASDIDKDNSRPNLDAFLSYGLRSEQKELGDSFSKVTDPYYPKTVIGLSLSMTLDRKLSESAYRASKARESALISLRDEEKKNYQTELQQLLTKHKQAVQSFRIAKQLEELQKNRLDNEQSEFRNGRSTTQQMLLSTQDLAQSELSRLQAAFEIKTTEVKLALFKEPTP